RKSRINTVLLACGLLLCGLMTRQLSIFLVSFSAAVALFTGCKKAEIRSDAPVSGVPHEPQFQNESQFVVHAIVSDIAEEMYFAKFHRLPAGQNFSTVVTESGGSVDE